MVLGDGNKCFAVGSGTVILNVYGNDRNSSEFTLINVLLAANVNNGFFLSVQLQHRATRWYLITPVAGYMIERSSLLLKVNQETRCSFFVQN